MSKLGYTSQKLKDKMDAGQFLSKEEHALIDMETLQAAEQFALRHKNRGSAFLLQAAQNAAKIADQMRNEDLRKQGREAPAQDDGKSELRRQLEAEMSAPHDPLSLFDGNR